jgi:hypothetical protein
MRMGELNDNLEGLAPGSICVFIGYKLLYGFRHISDTICRQVT